MTAATLTLSVLDQSPVLAGGDPAEAIRQSVELAVQCERCIASHGIAVRCVSVAVRNNPAAQSQFLSEQHKTK